MKIENTSQLAALISKKLQLVRDSLWTDRSSKVVSGIDFDYGEDVIYITLTSEGSREQQQDLTLTLSADIHDRELATGESIVEFKHINILNIESDSYAWGTEEIEVNGEECLKEVVNDVVLNANFYRLVDSKTYTTDDLDATYSEMNEQYEKYGY